MTTANKLAEQVLRMLSGGDPSDDSGFDLREIKLLVIQVLNTLVRTNFFQNIQVEKDQAAADTFLVTFRNIPLAKDEETDEYYFLLPAFPVDIPGGKGLKQVSGMQDENFLINPAGADMIYRKLPAGGMGGNIGCHQEGQRMVIENPCNKDLPDLIKVKMITAGVDDKPLPIPPDQEILVVERVFQLLGRPMPQDKVSDSNKTV
jgi:hypothetical protein